MGTEGVSYQPENSSKITKTRLFDFSNIGARLLWGLTPSDGLGIGGVTDNTSFKIAQRSNFSNGIFDPLQQSSADENGNSLIKIPHDISLLEAVSLIESLYHNDHSIDSFNVREAVQLRLFAVNQHLHLIKEKLLKRSDSSSFTPFITDLSLLSSEISIATQSLGGHNKDLMNSPDVSSLIGFSDDEVDDRLTRFTSILDKHNGQEVLEKYSNLVIKTGFSGITKNITQQINGELALALFSRGNKQLFDHLCVHEAFDIEHGKKNFSRRFLPASICRFVNQFFSYPDLTSSLIGSDFPSFKSVMDSNAKRLRFARETGRSSQEIDDAQFVFLKSMLKEVSNYDGWISNLSFDVASYAPNLALNTGEFNCYSRCAVEYGALRAAGWEEKDIFSVVSKIHTSLIVKTKNRFFLLENYPHSKNPTKGASSLIELRDTPILRDLLDQSLKIGKSTTQYKTFEDCSDYRNSNYSYRTSEIYPGNRGLGLFFLCGLSRVLGNNKDRDMQFELLQYIWGVDPQNEYAKTKLREIKRGITSKD